MDKKNIAIGICLLLTAFGVMLFGPRAPNPPPAPAPAVVTQTDPAAPTATAPAGGTAAAPGAPQPMFLQTNAAFEAGDNDPVLQNGFVRVRFTAAGGAIRDVAFITRESGRLKYFAAGQPEQPFIFNELHADPLLAIVGYPGLDRNTRYTLVSSGRDQVVYRAVLENRLEVTRTYTLPAEAGETADPYQLQHRTTFRDLANQTAILPRLELALGTAAPVNASDTALLLATGHFNGEDASFITRSKLEASSGFLGFGARLSSSAIDAAGPVVWGMVGNQFFASILTPAEPAAKLTTRRVKLLAGLDDSVPNAYGITATAQFDLKPVAAGGTTELASALYVGPKEFSRLSQVSVFPQEQDKVMQYSSFFIFRWCAQILSTLMSFFHSVLPESNWGWGYAIMLATLALKVVFLPLTFMAARSMKRMQKIQPEMMALREKYKDNPRKMQEGMMELYKVHKVNPLGGCIPMLIPLPFFMGFFSMLQSTAELRFAPFLWAADLSAPDTIAHLGGVIPINIMPVLMGATMVYQMKLVPTPPTADNLQLKMMKFMPYLFAFFCYNFSCALSLYSTVNGIFTIGQQIVINRMKDDGDPANHPAPKPAAPGGKPLKNVTPKKK
jgi:YidC/Oxa1 family membrane protein insertase